MKHRNTFTNDQFTTDQPKQKIAPLAGPLSEIEMRIDLADLSMKVEQLLSPNFSSQRARPPYPTEMMVRILIVKRLYNLSDEQIEGELLDRISFRRFCNLEQMIDIPDRTTIMIFENKIKDVNAEVLLDNTLAQHLPKNTIKHSSEIISTMVKKIDSTVMEQLTSFLTFEIKLRHELELNPIPIKRLYSIKEEIEKQPDTIEFTALDYQIAETIFYAVQSRCGLKYAVERHCGPIEHLEKKEKLGPLLRMLLDKFSNELRELIQSCQLLQEYPINLVAVKTDIPKVYAWWTHVTNSAQRRKNEWLGDFGGISSAVVPDEDGFQVEATSIVNFKVLPAIPTKWDLICQKLGPMDPKNRLTELTSLLNDGIINTDLLKKIINYFEEHDFSNKLIDNLSTGNLSEIDALLKNNRKRFRNNTIRIGPLLKKNQIKPALIGLMCWDEKNKLGSVQKAISSIKGELECLSRISAIDEVTISKYYDEIRKKIKRGYF
ncbi:transposase [Chromobacterium sphagni]|uniref:transposase n=1 Tax=Chromobacterium sphagni TaxID=1903179 RepID=UPI0009F164EF